MAFGFPAYHTEYCTAIGNSDGLRAAARSALKELGWPIRAERSKGITASVSCNMKSWGERVFVNFLPDGSISVTSKCAFPLQCIDWGKNEINVLRFMSEIRKHVSQRC